MRRIYFALFCALLFSWGCHKKTAVAPPPASTPAPVAADKPAPSPPAITPPPRAPLESVPVAKTVIAPTNLELAELNFKLGNYSQAAEDSEGYLRVESESKNRDRALFIIGVARALANDSARDLRRSEAALKRLISEHPNSPYKGQAELILELQDQVTKLRSDIRDRDEKIKKLSEELRTLKEIDLQRKPSRPGD